MHIMQLGILHIRRKENIYGGIRNEESGEDTIWCIQHKGGNQQYSSIELDYLLLVAYTDADNFYPMDPWSELYVSTITFAINRTILTDT